MAKVVPQALRRHRGRKKDAGEKKGVPTMKVLSAHSFNKPLKHEPIYLITTQLRLLQYEITNYVAMVSDLGTLAS